MRIRFGLALAALLLAAAPASAQGLRIGLQEDPDALDPMLGGSFVGRIVFAALCDKLVDIDATLDYVPQLATTWDWGDGRPHADHDPAPGRRLPRWRATGCRSGALQHRTLPQRTRLAPRRRVARRCRRSRWWTR